MRSSRGIYENTQESTGSIFMFLAERRTFTLNQPPKILRRIFCQGTFVSLGVSLLPPLSRGSVHISSTDPEAPPIIDPKYFSNPLDVEAMARHLCFVERLVDAQPMASLIKPGGKRNHPTAFLKDLNAAKDYVRTSSLSNNHPTSSCPILPRDKGGVVNERLVVYGTNNLRIVDASVMPLTPQGNTQSSVYAVAERAADSIKEDHQIQT
jgi:choline dehydrogenase-like flavoprotein